MRFSDIQISDKELWLQARDLWRQSKYSQVFSLFQNEQLNKKILNAKSLNDLTDYIVQLENTKDDSFKTDKIKVSSDFIIPKETSERLLFDKFKEISVSEEKPFKEEILFLDKSKSVTLKSLNCDKSLILHSER